MKNQIDIVKDIADGMMVKPTNAEFYEEFNDRVMDALGIVEIDIDEIVIMPTPYNESWLFKAHKEDKKSMIMSSLLTKKLDKCK